MSERAYDSHGQETDSLGIPYQETFTRAEIMRLGFEVYLLTRQDSDLTMSDATADPDIVSVPQPPVKKKFGLHYRGYD